jgi:pre-60S factor REI1
LKYRKVFNSENAFKNHEISKKHLENAANYEKNKTMDTDDSDDDLSDNNGDTKEPKINWKKRFAEAQTEEEFNKVLEEKIKVSRKLEETECLFCNFKGNTFEEKMEHMTVEHTFFIPDVEYLANLKGLLAYLGEKISIGNTCIYCERMFHSLEAVRKHMLDKGHTKISYEEGPDLEIANFYDFSVLDDEDEDMENGEDEVNNQALTITSEGTELILPSGAHIGHRDYKRYYNQNLRDRNDSNSKALMTLSEKYKALGYYEIGSSGMTIEKERLEKMKAARTELKKYARERGVMGQKANDFHIPWGRLGQFKNLFLM